MNRQSLASIIAGRLAPQVEALGKQWVQSGESYFLIDNLLDESLAMEIYNRFPKPAAMMVRRTFREHKYVAAQMDLFDPLLEEIVFGFQGAEVRDIMTRITGMPGLLPDSRLYAGGISLMSKGHFLNPHLDNSHDNDRSAYRALNLLYYVSPGWGLKDGGNLELWPDGTKRSPVTIESRFNRLVVMRTDQNSWHSVNPVTTDGQRCCVSNYFFAKAPPGGEDYFHVTTFRGRPEQPGRDLLLRADAFLRGTVRLAFPHGVAKTKHIYKK